MKYKLSKKADNDFKGIYKYTHKKHGEIQAIKYTKSLEKILELLFENTRMGVNLDYIKIGLLQHEHKKHTILYRIRKKDIFIIRILRSNMQFINHI